MTIVLLTKHFLCPCAAVQAALRGNETAPGSPPNDLGPAPPVPVHERDPPPIPLTPRPPVPQHSQSGQSANGRHPLVHKSPRNRGHQEPLPIPPRPGQAQLPAVPPLPCRTSSSSAGKGKRESPPPVINRATSPPHHPNPPLPNRGPNRPSNRVPPPKKAPPQKRTSSTSMRGVPDVPDRPQVPYRGPRNDGENNPSPPAKNPPGPYIPPRQPSFKSGPPTPSKPVPGGNRPKPQPPARPSKKPGVVSPPPIGGHFLKEDGPLVIPSGERMSPREMANCIERDVPSVLLLISERSDSVPQQLEDLATLIENFADNARGNGVQFRITMTALRSQIGMLRDNAISVWQSNSDLIVEALNTVQHQIRNMSKNLVD